MQIDATEPDPHLPALPPGAEVSPLPDEAIGANCLVRSMAFTYRQDSGTATANRPGQALVRFWSLQLYIAIALIRPAAT
jgi:hypothetical protein